MIFLEHAIFSKKCDGENDKKLTYFSEQVAFLEYMLSELGFSPCDFDIGRDDTYQFFTFTLGKLSTEVGDLLEEKLEEVIKDHDLDLVSGTYSFKCSKCENLHITFYIKSLSEKNPFRNGEFDDLLYFYGSNTSYFVN
jgi:hypothetical protein